MMLKIASILAFAASVSAECPIVGSYSGMTSLTPKGRLVAGGCVAVENKNGKTTGQLKESDFVFGQLVASDRPCVSATCSNVPITVEQGDGEDECLVIIDDCFSNSGPDGEPTTGTLTYNCNLEPDGNHEFACDSVSFQLGESPSFPSSGLFIEGNIKGQGSVNWEVYNSADDKKVGMVSLSRAEEEPPTRRNLRA